MNPTIGKLSKIFKAPLSSGLILKAVGKIAPHLGSFVSGAYTAGYAADQILDFIRNKYSTPEEKRDRAQLTERANAGVARPDERAALSRQEQATAPFETAGSLSKIGAQFAGGMGAVGSSINAAEQEADQAKLLQEESKVEKDFQRERQFKLDEERRALNEKKEARASRQDKRAEQGSKARQITNGVKGEEPEFLRIERSLDVLKRSNVPPNELKPALRGLGHSQQGIAMYEKIRGPINKQTYGQSVPQGSTQAQDIDPAEQAFLQAISTFRGLK
jgi:hypothetical protein